MTEKMLILIMLFSAYTPVFAAESPETLCNYEVVRPALKASNEQAFTQAKAARETIEKLARSTIQDFEKNTELLKKQSEHEQEMWTQKLKNTSKVALQTYGPSLTTVSTQSRTSLDSLLKLKKSEVLARKEKSLQTIKQLLAKRNQLAEAALCTVIVKSKSNITNNRVSALLAPLEKKFKADLGDLRLKSRLSLAEDKRTFMKSAQEIKKKEGADLKRAHDIAMNAIRNMK